MKEPLVQPIASNITWSMDFMHDVLENGRKLRVLNIMDDYNRDALATQPAHSFSAIKVIEVMERLVEFSGKPDNIRVDNGSEFIANIFKKWCKDNHINIQYIQPGTPTQNAYIEWFNRFFREDVLDAYLFSQIKQVDRLAQQWRTDYNENNPHKSLMGMSLIQFKHKMEKRKFENP